MSKYRFDLMNTAIKLIKHHEGYRGFPYGDGDGKEIRHADVNGFLTIGYGSKLPLTMIESEILLQHRLDMILNEIDRRLMEDGWSLFDNVSVHSSPMRWTAFASLAYNLGSNRFVMFKKMLAAARVGDFKTAADEIMDSKYAKQLPRRAEEIAKSVALQMDNA